AENFVKKLADKGYGSGIVDKKGGLYRVSAGSYSSETEAESALDKFESDGFSGWILKN
ncbi:MAG: SPOR domain-containing protein, partial [Crocinitomicaceae bacterium]|nr:SPOR domain-containing protein [Crocinitomicaceae bacterium]